MPETNGSEVHAALERLKKRVDHHDEELVSMRSIVTDLTDAMVVQAHMDRKQTDAINEGREHEERIDARIAQLVETSAQMDERVAKLVAAIGELISRMPR